jgi:FLVCR family feline leukemia virus subgroup C receptor-related protein
VIDVYGCRKGVLVGSFFTAVGVIIKCFINQGFYICIIGQVFASIGQPFLLNLPAKLASVWFGPNERIIAVTIAVAC